MRILLALTVALALAVPSLAVADGATTVDSQKTGATQSTTLTKQSKTLKKKAKSKKKKSKRKAQAKKTKTEKAAAAAAAAAAADADDDELEVEGPIQSLSPLTVKGVTCAVPAGMSLAGFAVDDIVEMECVRVAGVWTLEKLKSEEEDDDELEVEGPIQSLSPLTVKGVTCAVPADMSLAGFGVGDIVEMKCVRVAGAWTLAKLESEDEDDDDTSSATANSDDDGDSSGSGGSDEDRSGPGGGDDD
jgi:hypothetical protein